ncbi:unnamed protein product [Effrenium voratum]|nr:unnamed protein product [Effrenium voratum]
MASLEHCAQPRDSDAGPQPMRTYHVCADASVEKLGVQFNGLPPGALQVKSVTAGSFGELNGVQTGDVLVAAGTVEDLQALEKLELEAFKSLLKGRPLTLAFHSEASPGSTYEILADASVSKMGIAFRGMPPGALPVKSVGEGFGKERGVRAGDVLLQVGKDEAKVEKGEQETSMDASLREVAGTQAGTQPQQPSAAEVREPTSETTAVSVGADPKETAAGMAEPQPSLPSDVPDKQVTGTKSEPQQPQQLQQAPNTAEVAEVNQAEVPTGGTTAGTAEPQTSLPSDAADKKAAGDTSEPLQPQQDPNTSEVGEISQAEAPTSETTALSLVGADPKESGAATAEAQPSLPSDSPDKQVTETRSEAQEPQQAPGTAEVGEICQAEAPTSETTAVSVGADPKESGAATAEAQPSLPSDVPDKQFTGTKSEAQEPQQAPNTAEVGEISQAEAPTSETTAVSVGANAKESTAAQPSLPSAAPDNQAGGKSEPQQPQQGARESSANQRMTGAESSGIARESRAGGPQPSMASDQELQGAKSQPQAPTEVGRIRQEARAFRPSQDIGLLRVRLQEAERSAASASAALQKEQEATGSAQAAEAELRMQLAEALMERDQLGTELGTEQLLRKRALQELENKKTAPLPEVYGQVRQLQSELSSSELALRGMQRRKVREAEVLPSEKADKESRLLRTEYKAEMAAAKRYRAAARPPAPPEPTGLQRAEAAAARGMRRLEMNQADASTLPRRFRR